MPRGGYAILNNKSGAHLCLPCDRGQILLLALLARFLVESRYFNHTAHLSHVFDRIPYTRRNVNKSAGQLPRQLQSTLYVHTYRKRGTTNRTAEPACQRSSPSPGDTRLCLSFSNSPVSNCTSKTQDRELKIGVRPTRPSQSRLTFSRDWRNTDLFNL